MRRWATEADYPEFNGELFAQNYFNNVLEPVAQLAANSGMMQSGDIFLTGFENYDPSCDHPRLHSTAYNNSITQLRAILPSGVLITEDVQGWYEDRILGVNYPNGIINIPYLGNLDFLSFSMWIPWLSTSDLPATRQEIRDAHFNNSRFSKTGVPSQNGRNSGL